MTGTSKSGRKPKPTALKLLQGNPGKRQLNEAEPPADILKEIPPAPEWMDDIATAQWDRAAAWLVRCKILAETDLHNLESYCVAYSHWRQAVDHIKQNGAVLENPNSGVLYKNPMVTAKNEFERQKTTAASALGLDPASRARLAAPGAKDADNPFRQLLEGKR